MSAARRVSLALTVLLLTACAAPERRWETPPIAEVEVQALLDAQRTAWDRGDFEAFMKGYLKQPELSFVGSSGLTRGWQQTLDNYRRGYPEAADRGVLRFDLEMVRPLPEARGQVAVAVGRWHLTREEPIEGWFSLVLTRRPEGLRIVHDHSSASDEPAAGGSSQPD